MNALQFWLPWFIRLCPDLLRLKMNPSDELGMWNFLYEAVKHAESGGILQSEMKDGVIVCLLCM